MTREEAKKLLPIIQAFAEGKTIQIRKHGEESYYDSTNSKLNFDLGYYSYRVKPEPKYRPFKDAEECWQEMQKHHPFGWIKDKEYGHYSMVTTVDAFYDDKNYIKISGDHNWSFAETMNVYTFADGAPFDINIEEE